MFWGSAPYRRRGGLGVDVDSGLGEQARRAREDSFPTRYGETVSRCGSICRSETQAVDELIECTDLSPISQSLIAPYRKNSKLRRYEDGRKLC